MRSEKVLALGGLLLLGAVSCVTRRAAAQQPSSAHPDQLARVAEIEIDPPQIKAYQAALREEIQAALRIEPGVLALFAVSVKDHPEQVRIFEVYASPAAYQAHLQTSHFSKYKATTQHMIRSLKLIETDPILLGMRSAR